MFRFLVIIVFSSLRVFGQMPGDLVSSFGNNGKVVVDFGDLDACYDLALDTNNNLYFCGASTVLGTPNNTDFVLGKLNTAGVVDSTFGVNGFYSGDFPKANASTIHEIRLVDDGLIIFGSGLKYGIADTQYLYVSKVDYNGVLDTTFADSGAFSGVFLTPYNYPGSITIQDNGKIVVCGAAYDSLTVQDVPLIGRLLPNGNPDLSFSPSGFKYWDMTNPLQDANNIFSNMPEHGAGGFFDNVLLMDNGNYFFSGFYNSGTTQHCLMAMIDSVGNFAPSFASGGYLIFQHAPSFENKIVEAVLFDNEILLGIYVNNLTPNQDFIVQAIDTNGSFSNVFYCDYNGQRDELKDVIAHNGKFFLSGYSTIPTNIQNGYDSDFFTLAKYDDVNTLNSQFASSGLFEDDFNTGNEVGSTTIFARDDKLVMGGYINNISGSNITDFGFMMVYDDNSNTVNEEHFINELSVYPNPVKDILNIQFEEEVISIEVLDALGNKLGVKMNRTNSNLITINVMSLPKGIYISKIELEGGVVRNSKFVVN